MRVSRIYRSWYGILSNWVYGFLLLQCYWFDACCVLGVLLKRLFVICLGSNVAILVCDMLFLFGL